MSAGSDTNSIAIGDLNGDGKPDMVVADFSGPVPASGGVSVFLGNNDGTFQAPVPYDIGGSSGLFVVIADVNGDGHADLVTATYCKPVQNNDCGAHPGTGSVLLGNGDGTFQPQVTYQSSGLYTESVAVGDLNGDGHPDIVFADACRDAECVSGSVSVLLGKGDGTFQSAVGYSSGGYSTLSVAIGDLNGDGHPDLIVSSLCPTPTNCGQGASPGMVGVLRGNGDGTFQSATQYSAGGLEADVVAVVDVNGDGHPDVVAVNRCYSTNDCSQGAVGVLLGNGDGTLQSPVTYGSGGYNGRALAVGDLNGDGHLDLVVTHQCQSLKTCGAGGEVGILAGLGDGAFGPAVHYPSQGLSANSSAIADINADGRSDLLVTNLCARSPRCQGSRGSIGILSNTLTVSTTLKIKSSANPSHVGQPVKLTATVKSASSVPDGSTVVFTDGGNNLGTATTTNGVASLTTSFSFTGFHTVIASYPGDSFHTPSQTALNQVVNP